MPDLPLLGKKVAVLVETEYIHAEIEYYKHRVPELGGELHLMSDLRGRPYADFVNDLDSPDTAVTEVHRLRVTECVSNATLRGCREVAREGCPCRRALGAISWGP